MLSLMIILVLVLFGLVVFGVGAFLVLGGVLKIERDQNKAEKDSARILDATFDGREDVTFVAHMRTLKYETVILGAKERGYKLTHQSDGQHGPMTLIFGKVAGNDK